MWTNNRINANMPPGKQDVGKVPGEVVGLKRCKRLPVPGEKKKRINKPQLCTSTPTSTTTTPVASSGSPSSYPNPQYQQPQGDQLLEAAENGDLPRLCSLLKARADVLFRDERGSTALW